MGAVELLCDRPGTDRNDLCAWPAVLGLQRRPMGCARGAGSRTELPYGMYELGSGGLQRVLVLFQQGYFMHGGDRSKRQGLPGLLFRLQAGM
jgi:hypothetical protein